MSRILSLLFAAIFLSACVGEDILEDYVPPRLEFRDLPDTLKVGTDFQLSYQFVNNVGQPEDIAPSWSTSDAAILTVTSSGLVTAIAEGTAAVTATLDDGFGETVMATTNIAVGAETVIVDEPEMRTGKIATTSTYRLTGDFTLTEMDGGALQLTFADNYDADSNLPGLYVYLSNNPRSRAGAFEIGRVETFRGSHTYEITGVDIEDFAYVLYFCRPFNVEVGSGEIVE